MSSSHPKYSSPSPVLHLSPNLPIKAPKPQPHTKTITTLANLNPTLDFQTPLKNPYKKFTVAKLCEWRGQGLCHYCDEKYNPSHNCRAQCFDHLALEDLEEVFSLLDLLDGTTQEGGLNRAIKNFIIWKLFLKNKLSHVQNLDCGSKYS